LKYEPENAPMKEGLNQAKLKLEQGKQTQQNPFASMLQNPQNIQKLMNNPKTAAYMKDPQFMQMFQMCVQNPQMMSSMMQSDPRFMEVLSVLLGLDNMPKEDTSGNNNTPSTKPTNIFEEETSTPSENIFTDKTEKKPKYCEKSNLPTEQQEANEKKDAGTIAYKAKKFEEALLLYQEAFDC
jgi:stress-induced-phosphoprotein 1